jgi:hypothetical protein
MARDNNLFRCVLGLLTLSVRVLEPNRRLSVRVVARRPGASTFEHALVIPPGTILKLTRAGGRETRFVRVRAFAPRLQYGGRFVAGGVVELV